MINYSNSLWRKGFVKVKFKTTDLYLSLATYELNQIISDWQAGKAFGQYTGLYGHLTYVKLGEIVAIILATSESIALQEADDLEDTKIQKQLEKELELI